MKSLSVLLLIAFIWLAFGPQVAAEPALAPDDARVRVMTFNIRYDNPNDGENAWPRRKEMVASMIRFHHADLVGVQEALRGQIDALAGLLPEYAWFGVGRDDGRDKGEFSAIFYRRDRFTRLDGQTFWLSETPEVIGSKSWDAAITRVVTWCKFRDLRTKKVFYHFNTHFDHRGVQAREQSARLLRARIPQIASRQQFILTGDFNCNESAAPYQVITAKDAPGGVLLFDTRYISKFGHHGPTTTFNNFKTLAGASTIDYIFVGQRIRVWQHGALSDTFDGRFPSDHIPVLAEIELE